MRLRIPLLLFVAALAGACIEPLETPDGRFGTITAAAVSAGASTYAVRPEAAFYDRTDLTYEPFTNDTCLVATYSPSSTTINGSLRFMDAGEYLLTSVSGRVDSLLPVAGIPFRIYQPQSTNGIPFTPGDTLTVTVPGASFPASAISVRTAEAFTHGAIGIPASGADLALTWTPAPVSGSQMTFSLRYANAFGTAGLNEQIFCSFIDDGAATIPAGALSGWITALNDVRATRVVRIRSRQITIDARTVLSIISSFAQPIGTIVE